jgi:hypothetical protein
MYKLIGHSLRWEDFNSLRSLALEKNTALKNSPAFVKAPIRRKLKLIKKEIQRIHALYEEKFVDRVAIKNDSSKFPINYWKSLRCVEGALCEIFLTDLGLEAEESCWIDYLLRAGYTNNQINYVAKLARKSGRFARLEEVFYLRREDIPLHLIPFRYKGQTVHLDDFYKGVAFARKMLTSGQKSLILNKC